VISQQISVLLPNGQNAHLWEKSEIKLTVDHVGPLDLLKLQLIDGVLLKIKVKTQEYQWKMFFHAVTLVDMDVKEVIQLWPGNGGLKLELSLVMDIKITLGVNRTFYQHVD